MSKFENVLTPLLDELDAQREEIEQLEADKAEIEYQLKFVADLLNKELIDSDGKDQTIDMLEEELEYLADELEYEEEQWQKEPILYDSVEDLEAAINEMADTVKLGDLKTVDGSSPSDETILEQLEAGTYGSTPQPAPQVVVPMKKTIESIIANNLMLMDKGSQPNLAVADIERLFSISRSIA